MRRLLVPALLAISAAPSSAQWREWPRAPEWSRDEAAASRPVALNFRSADLDRDGRLSALEFNNIALALAGARS